jgi:protein-tyrosine-phosphatase
MKIVFVCTGNTCRSPMAAALFRQLKGEDIVVSSAGLSAIPGEPATPEAVQALAEQGIALEEHRARLLSADLVREADLLLTMTGGHRAQCRRQFPDAADKVFTLGEFAGEATTDVPDPFGLPLEIYRQTAAELERLVRLIILKLN